PGHHMGGVEVERVVIGGTRLDGRPVLELDGEVTPFLGAETGQAGPGWRSRELRDLARPAHHLLRVEVEEELSGLGLPAALTVPGDHPSAVGVDAEAREGAAADLAAERAEHVRDLPPGGPPPGVPAPPRPAPPPARSPGRGSSSAPPSGRSPARAAFPPRSP